MSVATNNMTCLVMLCHEVHSKSNLHTFLIPRQDEGSAAFWRSILYSNPRQRKIRTPSVSSQCLKNLTCRYSQLPSSHCLSFHPLYFESSDTLPHVTASSLWLCLPSVHLLLMEMSSVALPLLSYSPCLSRLRQCL